MLHTGTFWRWNGGGRKVARLLRSPPPWLRHSRNYPIAGISETAPLLAPGAAQPLFAVQQVLLDAVQLPLSHPHPHRGQALPLQHVHKVIHTGRQGDFGEISVEPSEPVSKTHSSALLVVSVAESMVSFFCLNYRYCSDQLFKDCPPAKLFLL